MSIAPELRAPCRIVLLYFYQGGSAALRRGPASAPGSALGGPPGATPGRSGRLPADQPDSPGTCSRYDCRAPRAATRGRAWTASGPASPSPWPERLLSWPVVEPSDRHDPFVAAGVYVIAVQGKVRQAVLLSVGVHGDLCEWHRLTGDNADAHVAGLRNPGEDPRPGRQLPDRAGVPLAASGGDEPVLDCIFPAAPSGNSPNETYQSRPFHGSLALDMLPPVGSGARS